MSYPIHMIVNLPDDVEMDVTLTSEELLDDLRVWLGKVITFDQWTSVVITVVNPYPPTVVATFTD